MNSNTTQQPQAAGTAGDWWARRPRRSRNDRKLAGVAGGLGRAIGVDPVLIRVAFVVLTIFGGFGILLYTLGWLLLPADGYESSALESLLGRGHSATSPLLTVLLIVIAMFSAGSVFSWGLPFWPVVIGALIVFALVRRGRIGGSGGGHGRIDWDRRAREFSDRAAEWGSRAGSWGSRAGRWGTPGSGCGSRSSDGPATRGTSPFERPPFWEEDRPSQWPAPDPGSRFDKDAPAAAPPGQGEGAARPGPREGADQGAIWPGPGEGAGQGEARPGPADGSRQTGGAQYRDEPPSPSDMLAGDRRTPPAWDPLGVAPFAWDLPDPTPLPVQQQRPVRSGAFGRVFLGLALIAGGLAAGGVFAGWWTLSWAVVSALALAVIGVGLLLGSLRGRGRSLIGPGIFLSVLTLALAITGISGTSEYGEHNWAFTDAEQVDNQVFTWNAGNGELDLSKLVIQPGDTVTTELQVNAGQATVIVPEGVAVEASCSANVGQVDCLDASDQGLRPSATASEAGPEPADGGADLARTLKITVHANAGHVEVRRG